MTNLLWSSCHLTNVRKKCYTMSTSWLVYHSIIKYHFFMTIVCWLFILWLLFTFADNNEELNLQCTNADNNVTRVPPNHIMWPHHYVAFINHPDHELQSRGKREKKMQTFSHRVTFQAMMWYSLIMAEVSFFGLHVNSTEQIKWMGICRVLSENKQEQNRHKLHQRLWKFETVFYHLFK